MSCPIACFFIKPFTRYITPPPLRARFSGLFAAQPALALHTSRWAFRKNRICLKYPYTLGSFVDHARYGLPIELKESLLFRNSQMVFPRSGGLFVPRVSERLNGSMQLFSIFVGPQLVISHSLCGNTLGFTYILCIHMQFLTKHKHCMCTEGDQIWINGHAPWGLSGRDLLP